MRLHVVVCAALNFAIFSNSCQAQNDKPTPALKRLTVSENRRCLQKDDGTPFFYLGDTAWELFHKLTLEEATRYFDVRAEQGFTVIQAVVLAEFDGLRSPNANGHVPLIEENPQRINEDYFRHVDAMVRLANERGLVVGLLPSWGDKWNKKWGVGPEIFTPENAKAYGKILGSRYKDAAIIWILGGDRPIEKDIHKEIIRAMAAGLREGDGGAHLMTFHPTGGQGSSAVFHQDDWLDFNMRQNGHNTEYGAYVATRRDYDLKPVKPVIDGEPIYEDHPIAFKASEFGHSIALDARRAAYWDLFSGACGHTYGNHSMWQFYRKGENGINSPLLVWEKAIQQPAARQMIHVRRLLESRPCRTRIPDDSLIVADKVATAVPGAGRYRFVATRDEAGAFAMIYAPVGRPFRVDLEKLKGENLRVWWFDPRSGASIEVGKIKKQGVQEFTSPAMGEATDYVLVLDDVDAGFSPPGAAPASVKKP
jgi:hypothetical protein